MNHRALGSWTLAALSGLLLITACGDTSTLPSEVDPQFAKGGGGIKVNSVDPASSPPGVTIDVTVTGSGFDVNSTVEFLRNRKSTPDITTNGSIVFVSETEIVANITIDENAPEWLYDIMVEGGNAEGGRRKGIGSEIFTVTSKGGGPSGPIELVSLTVEVLNGEKHGMTDVTTVDANIVAAKAGDEFLCNLGSESQACSVAEGAAFFGCPDASQLCSRILLTFSGGSDEDNIGLRVSHSVQGCVAGVIEGGCVQDPALANSYRAASWSQVYQPSLLIGDVKGTPALNDNTDGTRTLAVYWQGQRGQRRVWDDTHRVWSRYPDLDPVGGTDYFVFRAYSGNTTFQACTLLPDPCWTEYRGDAGTQAYVVLDDIQLLQTGRGKKNKTTGIEFEIQAFSSTPQPFPKLPDGSIDYKDSGVVASNLEAVAKMMLVDASGKHMLASRSTGINPDDPDKPDIYNSGYRFTFPESGCYEFHLLEVFVKDVDNLEYVWYSDTDPTAVKSIKVEHVQGGLTTWTAGGTC